MKAWIENGRVRDVAPGNPEDVYHLDIAKLYDTEVPDGTVNGAQLIEGVWVNPTAQQPAQPDSAPEPTAEAVKVSPVEFKLLFTTQERVAIKQARTTDPIVDDFFEIVDDPRLTHVNLSLPSTQAALGYLALQGLLAEGRPEQILAGQVQ